MGCGFFFYGVMGFGVGVVIFGFVGVLGLFFVYGYGKF